VDDEEKAAGADAGAEDAAKAPKKVLPKINKKNRSVRRFGHAESPCSFLIPTFNRASALESIPPRAVLLLPPRTIPSYRVNALIALSTISILTNFVTISSRCVAYHQ
jgi:hypothetical protein